MALCHVRRPLRTQVDIAIHSIKLTVFVRLAGVDSQIGRVIDKLTEVKATPDTLIVFHSDHVSQNSQRDCTRGCMCMCALPR